LYRKIYYESHASTEMSEFLLKEEALNEARQIESDFFWVKYLKFYFINFENTKHRPFHSF